MNRARRGRGRARRCAAGPRPAGRRRLRAAGSPRPPPRPGVELVRQGLDGAVADPWILALHRADPGPAWPPPGADPLLVPVLGGSLPLHVFTGVLGLPTFGIPLGNPDQANRPDENLDLDRFHTGVKTAAAVLAKLGLSDEAASGTMAEGPPPPPGTPAPPRPARDRPAGRAWPFVIAVLGAMVYAVGTVASRGCSARWSTGRSPRRDRPAPRRGGRGRRLRHPGRRALVKTAGIIAAGSPPPSSTRASRRPCATGWPSATTACR